MQHTNSSKTLWWQEKSAKKGGKVHEKVFETLNHWQMKYAQRSEENLRHFRLYGNSEVLGLRVGEYSKLRSLNKLTLNVIQAGVDTATARIAKTKPKAMFLTEDGDWSLHRKAKNLEQYVGGVFYQVDMYAKGREIFRDACVFGDGFIKWYFDKTKGRFCAERVFPEEIIVDEDEAIYGEPKQIHQVKYVTKESMQAMYPEFSKEIEDSGAAGKSYMYDNYTSDMIKVVESWRLPCGEEMGRHTISVEKCTLVDEDYKHDYYPFEKFGWSKRILGYWSQGIAEQLTGIQIEINKVLKTIQLSMHLGAIPKIFMETGSKIVKSHINNQIGGIIEYAGTMPESKALMNVPPELWLQLQNLYDKAFEIIGITQMSATGKKPADLESGKALREYHDIETERFSVVAQNWEDFYMRCAKKVIMMSKDLAEENEDYSVTALTRKGMKRIKWSEVSMHDDSYVMKAYPTNLFSDTPSGKWAEIKEMMAEGLFNKRQAYQLLDYPDVESVTSLENAIVNDIEATIEEIVDDGKYTPPEVVQDLEYALPIMQSAYLKYKRMGLPDKRLDLFMTWIEEALNIVNPPVDTEEIEDETLENEPFLEEQPRDINGEAMQMLEDGAPGPEMMPEV